MVSVIRKSNLMFRYALINIATFNFKEVILYNFFKIKKYNSEGNAINIILSNDKLIKL